MCYTSPLPKMGSRTPAQGGAILDTTTEDRLRQREPLQRLRLGLSSYLLLWAATLLGIRTGLLQADTPHWLLFGAALLVTLLLALRSRYCPGRDPSTLAFPHLAVATALVSALMYYANEVRDMMMFCYFIIMTFGLFTLGLRQLILLAALILCCAGLLDALEWQRQADNKALLPTLAQLSLLIGGLAWFIYIGAHLRLFRRRERQQQLRLAAQQQHLEATNQRLRDALEALERMAIRDPLTGIYNRRYFMERLHQEVARCQRHPRPLHLAMLDLDHFKRINDQYGHPAGDRVLEQVAEILGSLLRRTDLLARYGGEEFALLLVDLSDSGARQVLARLQQRLAGPAVQAILPQPVTFSAGVAAWRPNDSAEQLIERADQALYAAKHAGRDRVASADD